MATKRIKDLTATATQMDLISENYGVLDTSGITKKVPGYLLGGGSGEGNGIVYITPTTTIDEVTAIVSSGKLPVMQVVAGQGYDYFYPSWIGSYLTFVHIGRYGVVVKIWDNKVGGWTDVEIAIGHDHTHDNKSILDEVTAPYTTEEQAKLAGIEAGAQVNTIESISVNGTGVEPVSKNVNIVIPKAVPDPSAASQMLFSTDGTTWVPMTWETISFNTVTIGGKQYTTATVGSQIWLAGNLDLTWDGLVPSEAGTAYLKEPRANYYSDDENTYGWNGKKYGLLYNWAAVRYMDEHANTLFEGWHVPTSDEWNTLMQSLGASGAYELMTTTEWADGHGSDLYGFSAVPSGIRGASPSYSYGGNGARANFWTKTHKGDSKIVATMWTMRGDNGAFYYDDGAFKDMQGSVRLVKDV